MSASEWLLASCSFVSFVIGLSLGTTIGSNRTRRRVSKLIGKGAARWSDELLAGLGGRDGSG